MMNKKQISWITFNAFIDTDLYIVKELAQFYKIDWYVIRSENDRFEYTNMIDEMNGQDDLSIHLCVCGRRLRKLECIFYYRKMLSSINNSNPDLIFSSLAGAPFFIPVLRILTNPNKTVMAIHNVHVPRGGSAYYFFKFYNKFTVDNYQHFITYSNSQYERLKEIAIQKDICYVPFILKDYGLPNNERKCNQITFLNFGNIRQYKRIDILIDAAQGAYEETNIPFKVIIAGKCDNWSIYQQIIKYDFLFDIRIGRVENDEVANLFNECDYFVAPYQDIAQSGSSVVAINYCKPIIASRLPAFEEYIDDKETGYLIRPANADDLKNVITNILISKNENYTHMVETLRERREKKFSTSVIVNRYREFFNNVI